MNGERRSLARVYAQPMLYFAVSLAGLFWALLADSGVDWAAGLAAGSSLFVIARVLLRRPGVER